MSYFVLCLGKYIKNKYDDYCLTITHKKSIIYNKWFLCQDIETFIKKYVSKFDSKLEPSIIIQAEVNDIKDIKYITSEFLDEIFDVKISLENGKYINIIILNKIGNEKKKKMIQVWTIVKIKTENQIMKKMIIL